MSDSIPILSRNEDAQAVDLSNQTVQNLRIISRTMNNFFRDYELDQIEEDKEREQEKKDFEKKEIQKEKHKDKKDKKERGEFTKAITEAGKKSGEAVYKEGFKMMLGPLQLLTKPLEDFLGVDFGDLLATGLKTVGGKVKGLFTKKEERKNLPGEKEKPENGMINDLTKKLTKEEVQEEENLPGRKEKPEVETINLENLPSRKEKPEIRIINDLTKRFNGKEIQEKVIVPGRKEKPEIRIINDSENLPGRKEKPEIEMINNSENLPGRKEKPEIEMINLENLPGRKEKPEIEMINDSEKLPGRKEKPENGMISNLTKKLTGEEVRGEKEPTTGIGKLFIGKPTRQTVLPVDPGAVLLFDLFNRIFKGGMKGEEGEGILDVFGEGAGGLMKSIGPILAKIGGIAMLVGGVIWAVVDGISGFFKAKEWGTSKVSGVIGGVLGGTSKGLEGAIGNMGKWALIGAGIGTLIMPFIGTLIGGLIGGALGFILGWIGGERIAKFFDMVGSAVANFFTKTVPEVAGNIWKAISGFFSWIWGGIIKAFNWIIDFIGGYFQGIVDNFLGFFKNFGKIFKKRFGKESKKSGKNFLQKILLFFTDVIKNIGNFVWGFVDNIIDNIKRVPIVGDAMTWIDEKVIEPIKGFFDGIFQGIQGFISDPVGFVENLWGNVVNKVSGFFDSIKKGFDEFVKDPMGFIGKELNKLVTSVGHFFTDMGREFEFLVVDPLSAIGAIAGDKEAILKKEAFKEKKRTEDELKRKEEIRIKNKRFLREQQIEMDKQNLSYLRGQGLTQPQIDAEIQNKIANIKKGARINGEETKQLYQSMLAEMAKQKGKENVVIQNVTNTGAYNPDVHMSGGVPVH